MSDSLEAQFQSQRLANGYEVVDGVAMHEENGAQFQIPPEVIKRQIAIGQFVELRIDSPRFSLHEEDAEACSCPSCNGELSKPVLRHESPASLLDVPVQNVPARGWGEDFWVQVTQRSENYFAGRIDNPLCEHRLHGLYMNATIYFRSEHVLAVHDIHRREIVSTMNVEELKELAAWLRLNHE